MSVPSRDPSTSGDAPDGWRDAWAKSFGERWVVDALVMSLVVFLFGAIRPLSDPDLPMHLAIGEWIAQHRAVPFVEPFAWTKPGAPYYAYSWLPQTLFYVVFDVFGHLGLRAVQGLLVLGSALSVVVLSHAAGWRASQSVILAGFNLIVAAFFVALLRPQSVLLITLPLVWAGFLRISDGRRAVSAALMLFVASALTANSHLFFPLTLAPAVLLWARPPERARHGAIAVASVLAGWMTSPYSLQWLRVFRYNFAPNILLRPPSAITELQPGFVTMLHPSPTPMIALVVLMLAIPWALSRAPMRGRERLMAAVYWGGGLILFGYAARLFVAWWLLAILPAGWAVAHLTRDTEEAAPRARFRVLGLVACLVIVATELTKSRALWAMEGSTVRRTLPTVGAPPAERLATWLAEHANPVARPKLMTSFTFGSYLTWRMPNYSSSVDSRGIFPDSVIA
ncbi:MAG: hypothetical protein ABIP93_17840, partial [Gemmatimonadaceae bacterium]